MSGGAHQMETAGQMLCAKLNRRMMRTCSGANCFFRTKRESIVFIGRSAVEMMT